MEQLMTAPAIALLVVDTSEVNTQKQIPVCLKRNVIKSYQRSCGMSKTIGVQHKTIIQFMFL